MLPAGQTNPFGDDALAYIFKQRNYQPRSVLENLEKTCLKLARGDVPRTVRIRHVRGILGPGPGKAEPTTKPSEAEVIGYERLADALLSRLSGQQRAVIVRIASAGEPQTAKALAEALGIGVHAVYKQIARLMLTADVKTMKKKIPHAILERVSDNPARFDVVREVKRLFARV